MAVRIYQGNTIIILTKYGVFATAANSVSYNPVAFFTLSFRLGIQV
jgi:hypothetical protein